MKETYELIQLNKVNANNRKYVKENFKTFLDSVPVYFGRDMESISYGNSNLRHLVGEASNFKIDDQVVTCDIDLSDSKIKELIKKAVPIYCTSTGFGELSSEDFTVKDYVLECVDLCTVPSFKGIRNKMILKSPTIMETE